MSRKKTDTKRKDLDLRIQEHRKRWKDIAIQVTRWWSDEALEEYEEPMRAGTPKGDPVGFSRKKLQAAHLMILHPVGLRLKAISELNDVSEGVIRVWRTDEHFKKAVHEFGVFVAEKIGRIMKRTIEALEIEKINKANAVGTISNGVLRVLKSEKSDIDLKSSQLGQEITKIIELDDVGNTALKISGEDLEQGGFDDLVDVVAFLRNILPFYNNQVTNPFADWIVKMVNSSAGYTQTLYSYITLTLMQEAMVHDAESLRKWYASEAMLRVTKFLIETDIDLLSSPEAWKRLGGDEMKETAKRVKGVIFDALDTLAV